MLAKNLKRLKRKNRIRATLSGTSNRPRLSVFRSNMHISVQLIDDEAGKTLAAASDLGGDKKISKIDSAKNVGAEIAKKANELKIKEIVFDRGGFAYHGRVKALAEAMREAGIKF